MDEIRALADMTIRRALGFAGLGVCVVMLALSFDLLLSLRAGGQLSALVCLALAVGGWTAPRRDMRRTELWTLLAGTGAAPLRRMPRAQIQMLLAQVLRERLFWHAERAGLTALALGAAAALVALAEFLFAGGGAGQAG
ncbi:hypothetical protein [Caldovatus aquaticus]|uniref:Uncharacterized protein n=1 Tax=Caldovatus aquaticus TaxID=2865671 RepID=A0ABS7F2P2_9PROT|nr:hypothetical protein [Caldovatus aquaticus]MBW8269883.1 hypothetical protein [Caldovatus aquaticus]